MGSPETWLQLLHWDPALKLAPAVVSTLALMLVMSRFKSPWALPAILVIIPGIFFVVLLGMDKPLADAQDSGWVARPQVSTFTVHARWIPNSIDLFRPVGVQGTGQHLQYAYSPNADKPGISMHTHAAVAVHDYQQLA